MACIRTSHSFAPMRHRAIQAMLLFVIIGQRNEHSWWSLAWQGPGSLWCVDQWGKPSFSRLLALNSGKRVARHSNVCWWDKDWRALFGKCPAPCCTRTPPVIARPHCEPCKPTDCRAGRFHCPLQTKEPVAEQILVSWRHLTWFRSQSTARDVMSYVPQWTFFGEATWRRRTYLWKLVGL